MLRKDYEETKATVNSLRAEVVQLQRRASTNEQTVGEIKGAYDSKLDKLSVRMSATEKGVGEMKRSTDIELLEVTSQMNHIAHTYPALPSIDEEFNDLQNRLDKVERFNEFLIDKYNVTERQPTDSVVGGDNLCQSAKEVGNSSSDVANEASENLLQYQLRIAKMIADGKKTTLTFGLDTAIIQKLDEKLQSLHEKKNTKEQIYVYGSRLAANIVALKAADSLSVRYDSGTFHASNHKCEFMMKVTQVPDGRKKIKMIDVSHVCKIHPKLSKRNAMVEIELFGLKNLSTLESYFNKTVPTLLKDNILPLINNKQIDFN